MSAYITQYLDHVKTQLGEESATGQLNSGIPPNKGKTSRIFNQNMGINLIQQFGKDIAKILLSFSLSFRRLSATFAAEQGLSLKQMETHYGWRNEQTALKYIEKSIQGAKEIANKLSTKKTRMDAYFPFEQYQRNSSKVFHITVQANSTLNFFHNTYVKFMGCWLNKT